MLLPPSFRRLAGNEATLAAVVFEHVDPHRDGKRTAARRALNRLGMEAEHWQLYHTPWGQPRFRRTPGMSSAPPQAQPVVSFTDERDLRLAVVAHADGLAGIGLDLLDMSRFLRYAHDASALHRLQKRIYSPAERCHTAPACTWQGYQLAALRFGMKEAVSKAIGTGLLLGFGLGAGFGIPISSIEVTIHASSADIALSGRAQARSSRLGIGHFEAVLATSDDLLLSLILAWR